MILKLLARRKPEMTTIHCPRCRATRQIVSGPHSTLALGQLCTCGQWMVPAQHVVGRPYDWMRDGDGAA